MRRRQEWGGEWLLASVALLSVAFWGPTPPAHGAPDAGGEQPPREGARRDLWREPPPDGKTKAPTAAEWKEAEPVAARRPMPNACEAFLVREWIKIRCAIVPQAGGVLLGSSEDVAFHLHAEVPKDTSFLRGLGVGEVVFPLRRGEQRLIQLTGLDQDEFGAPHNQSPGVLISHQWLDGEPGPTLTLSPNAFETQQVLGARLDTPERARALGVETHHQASEYGWPVIVEVEPGSPAAASGAEVGDHVVMSWFGARGLDAMHEHLAFGDGSEMDLTVQRKGTAKGLPFRRRR